MSITEITCILLCPILLALGIVLGLYLENPNSWYKEQFNKLLEQVRDAQQQVIVRNCIIDDLFNIIRNSGVPEEKLTGVKDKIKKLCSNQQSY